MKNFFLTIFFYFSLLLVSGQNTQFAGVILFQSSGKKPAVKVGVRDKQKEANTFYSTETGKFNLIYPNKKPGDKIELQIDSYDGNNTPIEVVNDKELKNYISTDPNEMHEIIVCKKGQRDIAAQKYFKIIKTSADRELFKVKTQLDYYIIQADKNYDTVQILFKRLDELKRQNDSISIYKEAFEIASINKDRANDRVLRYIQLLDEGKSIQDARKELDIKKAAKELRESATLYKSAIEELEIRAKASRSLYDYKDAINCLDTIIILSEELGIAKEKIAAWYLKISDVLQDNGEYSNSLKFINKALPIYEKESIDSLIASTYSYFRYAYYGIGDYKMALEYDNKVLAIIEKEFDSKNPELARAYGNLSDTYNKLGDFDKALEYIKKGISIFSESNDNNKEELSKSYSILATIYYNTGDNTNALETINKAILIDEKIYDKKSRVFVADYNILAAILGAMGNNESALKYQLNGLVILEGALEQKHPRLANIYNNIGNTYKELKQYDKSLEYLEKSIKLYEELFDKKYPELAASYLNLGETYLALGNYTKALEYASNSIYISELLYDKPNYILALGYKNKSLAFTYLKQVPEALIFINKSIEIQKKLLPNYQDKYQDAVDCLSALLFQKGRDLYFKNNYKEAIENLEKVNYRILIPFAKDYLGICYIGLKDYKTAIVYFQELLKLDTTNKTNIHIYGNLGFAYAKNGQISEAKIYFEKYENQHLDSAIAYKNWAMYYALLKDKEKAIENLKKAIDNGYKNWSKISEDESFEIIRNDERYKNLIEKIKNDALQLKK